MTGRKGTKRDGRTKEPEYWSWVRMRRRCLQPKHKSYKDYGGRGISICPEWVDDYVAFRTYLGPKPSLDHTVERIDNDKNYEPGNVCWATRLIQTRNRRGLRSITHNGETHCMSVWAERLGLKRHQIKARLARLPVELALDLSVPTPRPRDCVEQAD